MKKKKETTTNDILLALLKQSGYEYAILYDGLYSVTYMGEKIVLCVNEERHSVTLQDLHWCYVDENSREDIAEVNRIVNELNIRGISKVVLDKEDGEVIANTMLTISLVNDIPQLGDYFNNKFKELLFHRGALTQIDYEQFDMKPDSVDYEVVPLVFDALKELACSPELCSDDWNEDIWFFYENESLMARINNNHPIAKIVYPNWYQFPLADFDQFAKVSEIISEINHRLVGTTLFWQIDEKSQEVLIASIDRFFVTGNREETVFVIKQIMQDLIFAKELFDVMLENSYEEGKSC